MKIVFYKTAPKSLKTEVKRLSKECFPLTKKTNKEIAEHKDKFDPSGKDYIGHIYAFNKDMLVGRVIVLKRKVKFNKKNLILGGVGGVCTKLSMRRKGIASMLLKRAMKELKKTDCEVVYLCADVKNPGMIKLYGQVGFVVLGKSHTYLGRSGKQYTDKDGMIAPVNSVKKFKEILEVREPFDIGVGNW